MSFLFLCFFLIEVLVLLISRKALHSGSAILDCCYVNDFSLHKNNSYPDLPQFVYLNYLKFQYFLDFLPNLRSPDSEAISKQLPAYIENFTPC